MPALKDHVAVVAGVLMHLKTEKLKKSPT